MSEYNRECDRGHMYSAMHPDDVCPTCANLGLNPMPGRVRKTLAIYENEATTPPRDNSRRTVAIYGDPIAATIPAKAATAQASGEGTISVYDVAFELLPVVAWMVAVTGPLRGKDYRIPGGRSSLGRDPNSRIVLAGDDTISSNQGFINYTRTRKFSISPGDGTALIYVNNQEVLSPTELNAFDRIEMGRSTFLFVPFCGEQFDWADTSSPAGEH